ncbi:TKL protein kinase [Phytophthora nicotianae]|uniref:LIM domain-containing serine/threonine-protein kinase n=2 Tax=Phytophthora nicotianae TaxID=4792 RepID=W2K2A4_PHYNI|nr:TKL protein kinase [Phytophthora nicotianae]KUF77459.1 LIM domain-containing serine/threonine-protein kinase [Phytophthora nicotianae]
MSYVLSLVLATLLISVQARTDIALQLYDNSAISKPTAPTSLNKALEGLVGDVNNFTSFDTNVQRAMLWSAGLVRAIPESDDSTADYVQVYVLCGRTMSDVFLSAETFDNTTRCAIKECKSNVISFTESDCEPSYVESKALCALSPGAAGSSFGTLKTKTGPLWSVDGQLDESFDPQIFQYDSSSTTDSETMYLLAQKSSWTMDDDTCPNGAQFIVPCREVTASEVQEDAQQRTWCEPEIDLGVKLWVSEAYAASLSSSDDSGSKVSSSVAIILGVLLGICIVAAIVFFIMWRHSRSFSNKDGLTDNEHNTFFMHAHSFRDQPQQGGNASGQYVSNNGPHPPYENAMQIEAINESFRMRSPELAAFCDDQELMLKRIAFAGVVYREKMSSGPNGEVWRGEYEGQQVAIKCTVAAAVASSAAANNSRSSAMNASALLGDKELKALVDFTKEIRMAAFLDHPNIVRFVGLSWRTLPDLCMVSEYVALGDLAHFLAQQDSKYLTWKEDKLPIAADISNALVYLHSLSPIVLHRDLKSLNVLLTEDLQAKVSDFGLSRETSFDETMTSGVGTLLWTAPEVLRGERYSEKADIYSFGVVLAELDTCMPPYAYSQGRKNKGKNDMDWVPLIASGRASPPFRPDCPRALRDLAAQCLDQDPNKRPPAMQIVYLLRSKIPHML